MRFGAEERDWGCFLASASGLITDGSPEGKRIYRKSTSARGRLVKVKKIDSGRRRDTLALEYFNSVLGEDFLRVYDEGEEEILATYSGDIFPHSIVFENQSSLTLKWTSLKLNSDKGFKVHYYTDRMDEVKCLNDCDRGRGVHGKERSRVSERKSRGGLFHRRASTRAGNEGKRDEQVPRDIRC